MKFFLNTPGLDTRNLHPIYLHMSVTGNTTTLRLSKDKSDTVYAYCDTDEFDVNDFYRNKEEEVVKKKVVKSNAGRQGNLCGFIRTKTNK